ncbi:hypothetical protein BDQ12DRAFT_727042 [Crucibulum laeve]|uniref:Uncharacterized protein n=1 Tax=Crucibulum laeve TaxID=68775 RepID=A0A5C3LZP7_9AGAR|nr:hypothetical protein BDQ12DRAFT_727042 [Crucibulum laeve]
MHQTPPYNPTLTNPIQLPSHAPKSVLPIPTHPPHQCNQNYHQLHADTTQVVKWLCYNVLQAKQEGVIPDTTRTHPPVHSKLLPTRPPSLLTKDPISPSPAFLRTNPRKLSINAFSSSPSSSRYRSNAQHLLLTWLPAIISSSPLFRHLWGLTQANNIGSNEPDKVFCMCWVPLRKGRLGRG